MNRRRWLLALTAVVLTAQGAPNISGKWHFVLQTEDGERIIAPTFQQDGEKITGKWRDGDVKGTFSNGKLDVDVPVNSEEVGPGILKLKGRAGGRVYIRRVDVFGVQRHVSRHPYSRRNA